jgi:glutathione S-transferase
MPFISSGPTSGGGLEQAMSQVTVFGFPRSTFVKVVRLILTEKGIDYHFHDTEPEMYLPVHKQRHPFRRVPVLQHGDFLVYETTAIAAYIDEVLPGRKLTPADPRQARAHEPVDQQSLRLLLSLHDLPHHARAAGVSRTGIPSNEAIVQRALPEVKEALEAMEARALRRPALHRRR